MKYCKDCKYLVETVPDESDLAWGVTKTFECDKFNKNTSGFANSSYKHASLPVNEETPASMCGWFKEKRRTK